jgi:hypothetical protein
VIEVRGVVPLWGSVERDADRATRRVRHSWFREDDPPFRRGQGVRILLPMSKRRGSRALHFGLMRRSRAKSHVDVLGRETGAAVEEISTWRPPEHPGAST